MTVKRDLGPLAIRPPALDQMAVTDNTVRYEPLGMDDEETEFEKPRQVTLLERRALRAILWAGIASLICTALNIFFIGFPVITRNHGVVETSSGPLEFVSPYIGLDFAIHHDSVPLPPIVNFPVLLAQVDAAHPSEVLLDTHRWNSSFGMIYPADRTFEVSPGISTIAQFRAIDWGMESCSLDVTIPEAPEMTEFMNFSLTGSIGAPEWVMVEVWRVSSPEITEAIEPHTLSWETKPPRKLLVGYWSLKPGVRLQSETFECRSNSLHTFEFLCSDPKCHLKFQQDPNDSQIAFFVTQRQSRK
ncbi:hypothetical protein C8R47DRAFT_318932 [Mycena vitilis]|nr:hypothetical protein C8R47DRAFT_1212420 [Mycena vitilis]KAJ6498102.1 hypothetical protein C8R47DRAFT_318932 [Mycena vitilis]